MDAIKLLFGMIKEHDLGAGLMFMFLCLHFYYGAPMFGLKMLSLGFAAVFLVTFILSLIASRLGNGIRAGFALTAAALALDFFYRGQLDVGAEHAIFNYLDNGTAAVNFASFGFAATWLTIQLTPSPTKRSGNPNRDVEA